MKKSLLTLFALVLALTGFVSAAQAAGKATVGAVEVKGKPTLVIKGSKRPETFQVTRYSVTPPEQDPLSGNEVPVYAVSEMLNGVRLAGDSIPGRCWSSLGDIYCRTSAVKAVIAKLGAGGDSFLADKGLKVTVDGGPGDDSIYGGLKNDVLVGGPGADYAQGDGGNDLISGGPGRDSLIGDRWRDGVFFRPYAKPAGNDRIDGGAGPDTIQGGAGSDLMLGGPGSDTFENNRDRSRDRIVGGAGSDDVHDPDVSRAGNGIAILDPISSSEFLYLGFRKYRLR